MHNLCLLQGGLNRGIFMPFIDLVMEHCHVIDLDAAPPAYPIPPHPQSCPTTHSHTDQHTGVEESPPLALQGARDYRSRMLELDQPVQVITLVS